jgi:hypothetical protein
MTRSLVVASALCALLGCVHSQRSEEPMPEDPPAARPGSTDTDTDTREAPPHTAPEQPETDATTSIPRGYPYGGNRLGGQSAATGAPIEPQGLAPDFLDPSELSGTSEARADYGILVDESGLGRMEVPAPQGDDDERGIGGSGPPSTPPAPQQKLAPCDDKAK